MKTKPNKRYKRDINLKHKGKSFLNLPWRR